MDPLLAIKVDSFSSIWYWIMTGIAWSMTCHFTIGVPYDSLVRAHSKGGKHAEETELLAKLQVRRITGALEGAVSFIVAVVAFFLAILATFGFGYGYEIAQATFLLLAPLVLVHGLGIRLAFRIARDQVEGPALRKALVRRRFWNQVIGLSSIFVASMMAFLSFARHMVLWY